MKIVLTGGHLTPAYAFSEIAQANQDKVIMIGSLDSDSIESQEMAKVGVEYRHISTIKYDRHHKFISFLKLPALIFSISQSIQILKQFRPNIVVTFGSYNAVPVAIAAYCLHIPFVTHEQTQTMGFANRLLVRWASVKAISYESTKSAYGDNSTIVTGNIVRKDIWVPPTKPPFECNQNKPILFITGGNQGSQAIIDAIMPMLDSWNNQYQLVIQYGKTSFAADKLPNGIYCKPWFSAQETAWLFHHAHLVISRGGANTVAELMVAGTPAVIIPLPNTTGDEQTKNAEILARNTAGIVIEQSLLNTQLLQTSLDQVEQNYSQYASNAKQLRSLQDEHAADKLYQAAKQQAKLS